MLPKNKKDRTGNKVPLVCWREGKEKNTCTYSPSADLKNHVKGEHPYKELATGLTRNYEGALQHQTS